MQKKNVIDTCKRKPEAEECLGSEPSQMLMAAIMSFMAIFGVH